MKITLEKEKVYCGNLLLVNAQYPVRCMENGDFIAIKPNFPHILLQSEAASALQLLLSNIMAGNAIVPVSGYRSIKEQTAIYQNSLRDNGEAFTKQFVATPGHSEHETGLAIDLGLNQKNIDFIRPYFPYKGICGDFRKSAPHFGFVERYPKGKEALTKIAYEPWHFRYVGYPHSKIMTKHRLTLEEYIHFIKIYRESNRFLYPSKKNAAIEVYYVPVFTEKTTILIPEQFAYQISGNNIDGFIVTIRRKPNEQV